MPVVAKAAMLVLSLAYPGAVYLGRGAVPPLAFVAVALALIGLRLAGSASPAARVWRAPLAGAAVVLAALALLDPALAAKFYPVVVSLGFAAAFGVTLRHPPSLVERFARRTEPDLPPRGVAYCRAVTALWTGWLLLNAVIAAGLALAGDDAAWALWTGLLSYLVTGALFAGEMLVRRAVRQRGTA
ncbi:hypothetical protein [Azospirillum rugosum]|uniref:Membrane protein n=1 Tax=Azospirillum rugosum TaxID=416170 RepID=A0ABS4SHJ8_9PROT|nr:hypothetical protein [Azospirillum rugosum]MBP2292050.1 putative membrane protein [Azospirillum rugosum]MDQ0525814.1 putative membrane protein [Azospirillum rugosum]